MTVTDSDSVQVQNGINLESPQQISILLTSPEYSNGFNVSCFQCSNGSVVTNVSGGYAGPVAVYTYLWDHGATTANLSGLGKGVYKVTITDQNNCHELADITITEPDREDWSVSGNSGSNASSNYIGTADNNDLVLKSNAIQRMRFKSDGVIDVLGNMKFDSLAGDTIPALLYITTDGTLKRESQVTGGGCISPRGWFVGSSPSDDVVLADDHFRVGIRTCDPQEALQIGDRWGFHSSNAPGDNKTIFYNARYNGSNYVKYQTGYSSCIMFQSGGGMDLKVDNATTGNIIWLQSLHLNKNGMVGIGTYTPTEQLEIVHNKQDGGMAINKVNTGNDGKSEIKFMHNGTSHYAVGVDLEYVGDQNFYIWDHLAGANQHVRFYINENGQVGIGGYKPPDNAPSLYKLFVEGGIKARDVKVTSLSFSDFVFKKNYPLMSIYELENFILVNGHLPGVPSEAEIIKNEGFEVGDLQVKQQKIIEEHALYIINLKREIDELKAEVKQLKKQKP